MSVYKVLFGGDLHKLHKDISTIKGYQDCAIAVQKSLMREIQSRGVTHFISLGDWYHKGYSSDISASLSDVDMDTEMAKLLSGNFYGLIGNHVRLRMDSNPELHIIQPHATLRSRRPITRSEPIMRTPDVLMLNGVQISFMHHNKDATDVSFYKPCRDADAKFHVALFHTHAVIPNAQLAKTSYNFNTSSNGKIGATLEGVDYAIVGDVHTPIGQFNIQTDRGSTLMCVPGSLTNTDASLSNRHTSVNLPLLTINEDGTVKIEYLPFDLMTNMLSFKEAEEAQSMKLKSVQGNSVASLYGEGSISIDRGDGFLSFTDFMTEQGYTERDRHLIRLVLHDPENLDEILRVYREG